MITSAQIRAARSFLDWTQQGLADAAGIGVFTVRRAEQPGGDEAMRQGTARKITEALKAGGVRLTESGGIEPRAK